LTILDWEKQDKFRYSEEEMMFKKIEEKTASTLLLSVGLFMIFFCEVPTSGNIITVDNSDGTYTMSYQPGPEDGKDAYLHHDYLEQELDKNMEGLVGYTEYCGAWAADVGGNYNRGLIQFDLSNLPSSAISAELHMYGIARGLLPDPAPVEGDVNIYQVTSAWDEWTVTWNSMPSYYIETPLATVSPDPEGFRRYEWDITQLYNDWQDGSSENHGLMLINDLERTHRTGILLNSSDYENPTLRPTLVVTVPEPTSIILLALGGLAVLRKRRSEKRKAVV